MAGTEVILNRVFDGVNPWSIIEFFLDGGVSFNFQPTQIPETNNCWSLSNRLFCLAVRYFVSFPRPAQALPIPPIPAHGLKVRTPRLAIGEKDHEVNAVVDR